MTAAVGSIVGCCIIAYQLSAIASAAVMGTRQTLQHARPLEGETTHAAQAAATAGQVSVTIQTSVLTGIKTSQN